MPRSLRLHIDESVEQRTGPLRVTGRGRTAASLDTKPRLGSESGRSNDHPDDDHNSCDYVTPFRIQQEATHNDPIPVWQMLVKARWDLGEFLSLRDGTPTTMVPVESIPLSLVSSPDRQTMVSCHPVLAILLVQTVFSVTGFHNHNQLNH
ncbi:hypothetical protein CPB86DRAFT_269688 [Serendipita vermifera]|nr:hypothetical protein CPB86DRAFT_269688 [Serendipita vermifera]